jgi:hypothetical protein
MSGRYFDLPKRESLLPLIDTGPMAGALVRAYPKKEERH